MRNKIFIAGIFAVSLVHAQTLYVNNSDGTFQAIDTKQTHEITTAKYYGVALTNESKVVLAKFKK